MKEVYLQVIDTVTGIYQTGKIEESVIEKFSVQNALEHFGVSYGSVNWISKVDNFMCGKVEGTTKVVLVYVNNR